MDGKILNIQKTTRMDYNDLLLLSNNSPIILSLLKNKFKVTVNTKPSEFPDLKNALDFESLEEWLKENCQSLYYISEPDGDIFYQVVVDYFIYFSELEIATLFYLTFSGKHN